MKNNNIIRIRAQIKLGSFLLGSENLNFNTKERRKSIKVIVSDEERSLIEAKANFYGYKTIASYIRDTAIYEKVTHVDLKSKNELYDTGTTGRLLEEITNLNINKYHDTAYW